MSDTWTYDPGYRPDDPRHGLSPRQLSEFYLSRPAQWMIRSDYGPEGLARRSGALNAHTSYLSARKDRIRFVGPYLQDDGVTPKGNLVMVDVPDRAAAEAFIAEEGFNKAGMFGSIEIRRMVETSLAERRQVAITADPNKQMYVCEMIDGPNGAEIRKSAGADHHRYQKEVMDSFVCRGPLRSDDGLRNTGTVYIIEVASRAAAEDFVAAEPLAKAGVFSQIRVDRWRFGKSIM